ncbi:hypothetical protein ET475_13770 [Microbacterium protaetiae]|uniref:Putative zinc-finger domain-containing protein n=1 Tax=Microbacterium protaetiae TaxID=2509458 RepID=A0A4V0YDJ7_9MICO|nr:zf-HC2 domain-containing protein [Microbacterium protaetiae]QAY60951.1 hypothetical protein ET475_13770 [Microbacterium protaetiae]
MTSEHTRYAEWDAAYILGALSVAERSEFEAHLEGCARCRQAVADLAPTVALLPRLSEREVGALERHEEDPDVEVDAAARAHLASLAHARKRRRRRAWWIASAAAVVLVVAAVATPVTIAAVSSPAATFALEEVRDVPLTASVRLTRADWGTQIDLDCRYAAGSDGYVPSGGREYVLAVVDADGLTTTVSTWRAGPGSDARLRAATATPLSRIDAIEIRSADGVVLMQHALDRGAE